jgi:hypothetical protein
MFVFRLLGQAPRIGRALLTGGLIGGALLLAGCADGLVERQARDAQFVGKPEAAVLQSLGSPALTHETGDTTYLTYVYQRLKTVPGDPFCNGPGVWCGGAGFPPPAPSYLVCHTTFAVDRGVVRSFGLQGIGCG